MEWNAPLGAAVLEPLPELVLEDAGAVVVEVV